MVKHFLFLLSFFLRFFFLFFFKNFWVSKKKKWIDTYQLVSEWLAAAVRPSEVCSGFELIDILAARVGEALDIRELDAGVVGRLVYISGLDLSGGLRALLPHEFQQGAFHFLRVDLIEVYFFEEGVFLDILHVLRAQPLFRVFHQHLSHEVDSFVR